MGLPAARTVWPPLSLTSQQHFHVADATLLEFRPGGNKALAPIKAGGCQLGVQVYGLLVGIVAGNIFEYGHQQGSANASAPTGFYDCKAFQLDAVWCVSPAGSCQRFSTLPCQEVAGLVFVSIYFMVRTDLLLPHKDFMAYGEALLK